MPHDMTYTVDSTIFHFVAEIKHGSTLKPSMNGLIGWSLTTLT